jgi:hypothetical protein
MDRRPLYQKLMERCNNFNGLVNRYCKANIEYETVKDKSQSPFRFPCFSSDKGNYHCDKAVFPNEAEAKELESQSHREIQDYFNKIQNDICPICDKKITKSQIGRCVYGSCGHRLYQGKCP